jgi:hypothetical protein
MDVQSITERLAEQTKRRRAVTLMGAILLGALWTLSVPAAPLQAQEDVLHEEAEIVFAEAEQAELAKAASNPLASLISVPFQNNTSFGIGGYERTSNVLNIQPVIPISLSKSLNLITRTIVPVISAPNVDLTTSIPGGTIFTKDPEECVRSVESRLCGGAQLEAGATWGLGDLTWTGFFTPANAGTVMVGGGPALMFPTGTSDETGSGKWGAGPSVVLVATPGKSLLGLLVNNIWSYAGDPERADVNHMLIQYFINYNFPKGWYLSTAPIITSDWTKPASQGWIVPFGGGGGRVFNIGKQPINSQIQAFYNAVTPKNEAGIRVGPEWSLRLQVQLLFPT